jgi:hypothetical protein
MKVHYGKLLVQEEEKKISGGPALEVSGICA